MKPILRCSTSTTLPASRMFSNSWVASTTIISLTGLRERARCNRNNGNNTCLQYDGKLRNNGVVERSLTIQGGWRRRMLMICSLRPKGSVKSKGKRRPFYPCFARQRRPDYRRAKLHDQDPPFFPTDLTRRRCLRLKLRQESPGCHRYGPSDWGTRNHVGAVGSRDGLARRLLAGLVRLDAALDLLWRNGRFVDQFADLPNPCVVMQQRFKYSTQATTPMTARKTTTIRLPAVIRSPSEMHGRTKTAKSLPGRA